MAEKPDGQPRPKEELQGEQIYRIERKQVGATKAGAKIYEMVTRTPLAEQARGKFKEATFPDEQQEARNALDSALVRTVDEIHRQNIGAWRDGVKDGVKMDIGRAVTLEKDAEKTIAQLSNEKTQEFVGEIVDGKRDEFCWRYLSAEQLNGLPDKDLTRLVEFLGRDEKKRWSNLFQLGNKMGMAGAERVGRIEDELYPEGRTPSEGEDAKSSGTKPEEKEKEEEAGIPEDLDDEVEVVEARQQKLDKEKEAVLSDVFGDKEAKAAIEQMRQKRERQFFSVVKRWNKAHHDLRINKVPRNLQERDVPIERLAKELQEFIGAQQGELTAKRAEKLLVSFVEREKALRKESPAAAVA